MNDYIQEKNKGFEKDLFLKRLKDMLLFVETNFPNGFIKAPHHTSTPRVRFEAISLGVHYALLENPDLKVDSVDWLDTEEFQKEVTGSSTNIAVRLKSRINFVKNKLLQNG